MQMAEGAPLPEMTKHHVKEEEPRLVIFAEAKQFKKMALKALDAQMVARKWELIPAN